MSNCPASQLVLYTSDSVEASYADGSRLLLSPCGTTFRYYYAPSLDSHPLKEVKKVQQRTEFVTSSFREQVREALDFRNRFAQCAFLARWLMKDDVVHLHANIEDVAWPSDLSQSRLVTLPSGDVKLVSEDEYATVTLAANHQHYTVEYLAKLSSKKEKKVQKAEDCGSGEVPDDPSTVSKSRYTWVIQHGSMAVPEPCWQPILELLLTAVTNPPTKQQKSQGSQRILDHRTKHKPSANWHISDNPQPCGDESPDAVHTSEPALRRLLRRDFHGCLFTVVPQSLPLSCPAQHLHRWPLEKPGDCMQPLGKVKVICMQGIIYRLVRCNPHAVEIYPGDGSTFRSQGLAGHFFTQYVYTKKGVTELMHSVKAPPPTLSGAPYSVGRIIHTAAEFLKHLCDDNLLLVDKEEPRCWEAVSASSKPLLSVSVMPTTLLEECTVDGLGRFSAYTNGHIRVVFTDRTCLDMCADLTNRLSVMHVQEQGDVVTPVSNSGLSPSRVLDLPEGMCRLLLPSGHYQLALISSPQEYDKYVGAAVEWAAWVNTLPSERYNFYKDTVFDPEKHRSIQKELKKIECFNYIVDHQIPGEFQVSQGKVGDSNHGSSSKDPYLHSMAAGAQGSHWDLSMVQAALQKTSAAVQDLDHFLNSNGEMKPVRD